MNFKPLSFAIAALAAMAASSVMAVSNGEPSLPRSIDPNVPTVDYLVALIEVDHTVDKRAIRLVGQQLSKSKDATLASVSQSIAGKGKYKVLVGPSITAIVGEPYPLVDLSADTKTVPVHVGNTKNGVTERASVGYQMDVVPTAIDTGRGRVDTTMRIRHSVKDGAGNVVTTDVRDRSSMAPGDVYILSWVAAGKQYAMAVKAERF